MTFWKFASAKDSLERNAIDRQAEIEKEMERIKPSTVKRAKEERSEVAH